MIEVPLESPPPRPRAGIDSQDQGPVERLLEADAATYALTPDGLYQGRKSVSEVPASQLTDRNISALMIDQAGQLWVGFFDHGLDVLDGNLEHARHYEDQHIFCVNRIVRDPQQDLTAVATANGLVLFDAAQKQRRVLTKADGLIAGNVTDVLFRPEGRNGAALTLATPAGLTILDKSGMSSLYAFQGLVNNHAYTLASLGSKVLVGTLGGLSMLDQGVVEANYTTANSGLKQNWITAIEAVDDEWFIGTYGAGIVKLDARGKWDTFVEMRGQIEINSNAMQVTRRAVYAGTLGRGLAAYNRVSGRWSFLTAGLPSLNVTALAAGSGYLYVGTDNGLVRIAEQAVPLP